MSHLKKKSEDNIKAAKKLIDEQLYASSVHCSYYACLQFIKYIYIDDDDFIADCNDRNQNSHNVIIFKISNEIYEKTNDVQDERHIRDTLFDLKKTRIEADYEEAEIIEDKAKFALLDANQLLSDIIFFLDLNIPL